MNVQEVQSRTTNGPFIEKCTCWADLAGCDKHGCLDVVLSCRVCPCACNVTSPQEINIHHGQQPEQEV
eukprot:CAMPEP_0206566706 /NCGR_PEP_ID=MMETSP0325_2-20121206/24818_1 /ASSEMBLY_ACC=CAM_ASM_000347 /TAXON_ID=2866 /ORGANISM="Crypthecodinium cohnii, Strain Seligo" /LENGTH=67 /DNA_ID=CAMNT_0054069787 /DNA_START=57 /DNA_END=260 /DNA_ORIENTATION=+